LNPIIPYAAPSAENLSGIARRGAAGSRTLPKVQGCPFWQTPIKPTEHRKQAASGGFLLDTFLCPRKEKYLAFGCENPIKISKFLILKQINATNS
jgi:hypothetical protein